MGKKHSHGNESHQGIFSRRDYLQMGSATIVGASTLAAVGEYIDTATAVSTTDPSPSNSEIGGGAKYNNDITRSDATMPVVYNASDLKNRLSNASSGDVIWIDSDATIDLTGESDLSLSDGVTLASGRGINGSQGALLHVDEGMNDSTLFYCNYSNNIRFTGLQFRGPHPYYFCPDGGEPYGSDYDPEYRAEMSTCIYNYAIPGEGYSAVIDNCHFWGWTTRAIRAGSNSRANNIHVHHCSIHHNAMEHLGYGIDLVNGPDHLIEYNYFEMNRHCINGYGFDTNGYEARYNYVGGGEETIDHPFDMHCPTMNSDSHKHNGGGTIHIHHNTFEPERMITTSEDECQYDPTGSGNTWTRDGRPETMIQIVDIPDDRCDIENNWFKRKSKPSSAPGGNDYAYYQSNDRSSDDFSSWQNLYASNNAFGLEEPAPNIGAPRQTDGGGPVETARETGYVTIDQPDDSTWFTEGLNHTFSNPVAFLKPLTHNGSQPVHARLRNVGSSSFEMKFEEWDYLDGGHVTETGHFFIVDQGTYTTNDDIPYEAGTVTTDENWETVTFSQDFSQTPVIFTQSQTVNGPNAMITRKRNISSAGFDIRVSEEENPTGQGHVDESLGYFAIEPGIADFGDATVEFGTAAVNDSWTTIDFNQTHDEVQRFLADVQTLNGDNPVHIRRRNLSSTNADVFLEEETSADTEISHVNETVGYMVTTTSSSF